MAASSRHAEVVEETLDSVLLGPGHPEGQGWNPAEPLVQLCWQGVLS